MRNKNMLILLLCLICLILILGAGCGAKEKVDPREREIIVLLNENKHNEAISKAKELYKGEEEKLEEILEFIQRDIEHNKKEKQMIQDAFPSTKLEIQSGHTYETKNNYTTIKGKVKNTSNDTISYFEVVVDLLDDEGNIIHSEYTNDGLNLKPDAMREFEIKFRSNSDYKDYKLSIGKVR